MKEWSLRVCGISKAGLQIHLDLNGTKMCYSSTEERTVLKLLINHSRFDILLKRLSPLWYFRNLPNNVMLRKDKK